MMQTVCTGSVARNSLSRGLKASMFKSGVNITQLEGLSGVNSSRISSYVNGKTTPSLANLYRIQEALHCDWSDLLGEPR